MIWSNGGSTHALVTGPASQFHLNYNTLFTQEPPPAPTSANAVLYFDEQRGDGIYCFKEVCKQAQINSGYKVISANAGASDASCDATACVLLCPGMEKCCCPASGSDFTQLYFHWSPTLLDNRVTNSSACPSTAYTNCGNADGSIYLYNQTGRLALISYSNAEKTHFIAAATQESQAWVESIGYTADSLLGFVDAPLPPTPTPPPTSHAPTSQIWGFGVSGDVNTLPAGFSQENLLSHSLRGATAAWDTFGVALRRAYNTTKKADEDVFLTSLTIWTGSSV
jgi:hypothetical protein